MKLQKICSFMPLLAAAVLLLTSCVGSTTSPPQHASSSPPEQSTKPTSSAAVASLELAPSVSDIDYPENPIQVVIPLAPGGDTDLTGRLFAKYMEKELGVTMVCNNITGAGGSIGARQVKTANPDGYTVLWYQYAGLVQQVAGTVDFSYIDDFDLAGVGLMDNCGLWLGMSGGKYNTLKELVEDARAHPGEVNVGLSGTGNMAHFLSAVIQKQAGVTFNLIDLGGFPQQQAALLSGQIAACTNYYSSAKGLLNADQFKALAIYSKERNPNLPNVPTMSEQGFDTDIMNEKFYYFAFPKGTPPEVVEKFSAAVKRVVEDPEAQKEFANLNIDPTYIGPEEMKDYMNGIYEEYQKYADVFQKK